jgi:hypothetical protein
MQVSAVYTRNSNTNPTGLAFLAKTSAGKDILLEETFERTLEIVAEVNGESLRTIHVFERKRVHECS